MKNLYTLPKPLMNAGTVAIAVLLSTSVFANSSYTTEAPITSVEPVYREHTVQKPYQDCYIKTVYEKPQPRDGDGSATNELVGGLIGGAIGNQFGGGSGKDAMTVAGALLGASLANDMEKDNQQGQGRYVDQRICETKYDYITENRLAYYNVGYSFNGKNYTFKSTTKPTRDTVNLRININPTAR